MSPRPTPPPGRQRPPRDRPAAVATAADPTDSTRARLIGLIGVALIAFTAGAVLGAGHVDREMQAIDAFAQAWERGDHAAMHELLDDESRAAVSEADFAQTYREAAQTMTLASLETGPPEREGDHAFELPAAFHTRIFGTLRGDIRIRVSGTGEATRLSWRPEMVFPRLASGESLSRQTRLPPRASILARDGAPLAEGQTRLTDLGRTTAEVTGTIGPVPPELAADVAARGLPSDALIGLSGLEREHEGRLAGRPGGRLLAGDRVVAEREPEPGQDVRTTIDPELQTAAVEALAGRYGGAVAIDPANGDVLALAGIAASAPQPPGSVFKIITLAAALEHGVVERSARFPVVTSVELEGVRLENADGESCGGSLRDAFAHSCNSVFAPLGVDVGAERLVATAERFGFNRPASIPGAQPSSLPPGDEIGDDLAIGSTAIGQGRVLATTLQMASVAATIAADGTRRPPRAVLEAEVQSTRAIPAAVAKTISTFMVEVVASGTGTAAAIPGVRVAGKTGTAELRATVPAEPGADPASGPAAGAPDPTDTDAWFAAFAPQRRPEVAVAIMLVGHGTGGANAAPAARVMLDAALD